MKINIFGSTGFIGSKTIDIVQKSFPNIKINLISANNNIKNLAKQIKKIKPKFVHLYDTDKINELRTLIDKKIIILNNNELPKYLIESKSDLSILAISGYKSLNYLDEIVTNKH